MLIFHWFSLCFFENQHFEATFGGGGGQGPEMEPKMDHFGVQNDPFLGPDGGPKPGPVSGPILVAIGAVLGSILGSDLAPFWGPDRGRFSNQFRSPV